MALVADQALHLGGGVAAGGQVELVGFVDQLAYTLGVLVVKGTELTGHVQAAQIVVVIGKTLLRGRPLGVLLVHLHPLAVICRQGSHLKVSAPVDSGDVLLGAGQFRHRHAGQLGAHDLPLRRVVIHKYKTFRQQVQLLGHGGQILVLGVPVGLEADKILPPQYAVAPGQAGQSVGLFVFAAHVQQHTGLGQLL